MRFSPSTIIIICAVAVSASALTLSASALIALRYQIVVKGSLIYRLDRWSGDIRVCIKQNPEDRHLLTCYQNGPDTMLADKSIPLPKMP